VEKQLVMFEGAVTTIEKNREKFPHVSDRELTTRKDIVFGLKQRWLTAKTSVNSRKVQGKIDSDRRAVRVCVCVCSVRVADIDVLRLLVFLVGAYCSRRA
jgi:hypothetical protein